MAHGLSIDLGTTYTAVAVARADERPTVVELGANAATIPTVVYLGEDDRLLVGEAAELAVVGHPDRGSREFKRRLGDTTPVFLGGSPFSADVLARGGARARPGAGRGA